MEQFRQQLIMLAVVGLLGTGVTHAQVNTRAEPERAESGFTPGQQRTWFFWSFLPDEDGVKGDTAETLGLEFENYINVGGLHIKNITYFEVNSYPRPIPGQPVGNPSPGTEAANGINDILSGFWISKQGHHGKHHISFGPVFQFPTASHDTLGSGKWSAGPTVDYEYTSGRLFAGSIAFNLWSFAGDSQRKKVNSFMAKPFVVYQLHPKWDLLYMPYGISIYWDKPKGQKAYVPLGGGIQRHFKIGELGINTSAQLFNNVIRPDKGTKWDLRFLLEVAFN